MWHIVGKGEKFAKAQLKVFFLTFRMKIFAPLAPPWPWLLPAPAIVQLLGTGGPSHSCVYHISGLGGGCHNYHAWRNGDRSINVSFYDIHEE